ncbi:type IV pilin N-terminal domain-containing protein [Halorubrum ezzemoulense]|uniref:type IV pilin N-terminal domain-containing protein n=1 Tax=Halorubrum ezzemoulense TaxID=337243 RepID=UPI002330696A|nr:type IV pilin N-terminal domain-containing protein [Halorubrum ezzemoulense]MDB9279537.1 type IV pilin N-terminal domain-containing protein [Halorubrum ezzemoulense]MDB9283508.1 type IV pilin N-terminal domain-containing protein [Halorubrum ezzemoulense]
MMNTKKTFQDSERAVSPVIGVILMVAITVILAAVIGTFVLGLGDQIGEAQPTAQLSLESQDLDNNQVTIVHNGGDELNGDDLSVTINGSVASDAGIDGTFSVGEEKTLSNSTISDGTTIRIIHDPSGSTLFDQTVES